MDADKPSAGTTRSGTRPGDEQEQGEAHERRSSLRRQQPRDLPVRGQGQGRGGKRESREDRKRRRKAEKEAARKKAAAEEEALRSQESMKSVFGQVATTHRARKRLQAAAEAKAADDKIIKEITETSNFNLHKKRATPEVVKHTLRKAALAEAAAKRTRADLVLGGARPRSRSPATRSRSRRNHKSRRQALRAYVKMVMFQLKMNKAMKSSQLKKAKGEDDLPTPTTSRLGYIDETILNKLKEKEEEANVRRTRRPPSRRCGTTCPRSTRPAQDAASTPTSWARPSRWTRWSSRPSPRTGRTSAASASRGSGLHAVVQRERLDGRHQARRLFFTNQET